jgi:hypothetical protein
MGGAGMFAVSLYTIFMGGKYDQLLLSKLPEGASLVEYTAAPAGSEMANLLVQAKRAAGPEILDLTLYIPIALVLAFGGLVLYMRSRKAKAQ